MAESLSLSARLFPRPAAPPGALELGPLRHGYLAGVEAYRGSVIAHAAWSAVYLLLGVPGFAAYQLATAALYVVLWRLHARGQVVGAFAGAVVEAIAQCYLASYYVGWDLGYQSYLAAPVVIAFLVSGVLLPVKVAITAACGGAWLLGLFFFADRVPAYELDGRVLTAIQVANVSAAMLLVSRWQLRFSEALQQAEADARVEQERSEALLSNILPASVVARLKAGESEVADGFAEVTVLFADLVGFTKLASTRTPHELVALLDRLFSHLDGIAERHGVEKIKTIGDAYMAAAGVPTAESAPAERVAAFATELLETFPAFDDGGAGLRLRVGLATGPAVAGVIGRRKFSYDLWGDTVNTASRMESHGEPGRIHVDERTFAALGGGWRFEARGTIDVKGKGPMRTWFLLGRA